MSRRRHAQIFKGCKMEVVLFPMYVHPAGFLDQHRETHACFFYYLMARQTYEDTVAKPRLQYEDEDDIQTNYMELFKSVATVYDIEPEDMANAWPSVDLQCDALHLPRLPNEEKYRFNCRLVLTS